MAHFLKPAAASGEWNSTANSLTLPAGTRSYLALWGGGPKGEALAVSSNPPIRVLDFVELQPQDAPDVSPPSGTRLIRIFAREPGTWFLKASAGANGPDYAKPAEIIVLPQRKFLPGNEHVVFYADDRIKPIARNKAGDSGAAIEHLSSHQAFFNWLTRMRDSGRKVGRLEFLTHGCPGSIQLEDRTSLNSSTLQWYKGRAFHQVFAPGARVFLHGCNVAEGEAGVRFLSEFGTTFLAAGGGSVAASTSVGIAMKYLGDHIYHLWGDTIRVHISSDGRVERIEKPTPAERPLPAGARH